MSEVELGEWFPGLNWIRRQWANVRLGHEAVMVDRIQRVQRIGEIAARNAVSGKTGDITDWPGSAKGEEMGVDIGDKVVHHHYYGKAKSSRNGEAVKETPVGKLVKGAIAAGLIASGVGLGVAVPWALGAFNQLPPPTEAPADTTTQIEVE